MKINIDLNKEVREIQKSIWNLKVQVNKLKEKGQWKNHKFKKIF